MSVPRACSRPSTVARRFILAVRQWLLRCGMKPTVSDAGEPVNKNLHDEIF